MKRRPRVVRVFRSFEEAELAEIKEEIVLSPKERLEIARKLRIRAFGRCPADIRASRNKS